MRATVRAGVQVVSAPQMFPTSSNLAARMVSLAARMVSLAGLAIGMRVLEPCAGTGRLLEALPGIVPFGQVKPGGRLVALCANGPRQNAILRPMVVARGGLWEDLLADIFKEEGAGVRVVLITMRV